MYGTGENNELSTSDYATQRKKSLDEAYRIAREKLRTSHRCQKECYDKHIHGKPFKEGDLVRLHSPVVLRGQSKKLHHPWTGQFKIVEQISENDYKIRNVERKKKLQVVHFDRLKLCTPGTRLSSDVTDTVESSDKITENPNVYSAPDIFGQDMELVDQDHLSYVIQEEIEMLLIVMHIPLLTTNSGQILMERRAM